MCPDPTRPSHPKIFAEGPRLVAKGVGPKEITQSQTRHTVVRQAGEKKQEQQLLQAVGPRKAQGHLHRETCTCELGQQKQSPALALPDHQTVIIRGVLSSLNESPPDPAQENHMTQILAEKSCEYHGSQSAFTLTSQCLSNAGKSGQ